MKKVNRFDAESRGKIFILGFIVQQLVHGLNSQCWDLCVDKPGSRLDSKQESCLSNCVYRFIDTTNFVVNRLEKNPGSSLVKGSEELLN